MMWTMKGANVWYTYRDIIHIVRNRYRNVFIDILNELDSIIDRPLLIFKSIIFPMIQKPVFENSIDY